MNEKKFLSQYDSSKYEKPSVTVDTLIFSIHKNQEHNARKLPERQLQILLVKRKEHPYKGQWAIPGGFVKMDESLGQAANRELMEETGLHIGYMEQLYTWGDVNRDPRMRVISVSYMALIDGDKSSLEAGDDAEEAEWFTIKIKTLSMKKTI